MASEMVPVASLLVRCSLKVRCLDQPGWAMSDSCGHTADTVVVTPNTTRLWRCPQHRGVLFVAGDREGAKYYGGQQTGPVDTMTPRPS